MGKFGQLPALRRLSGPAQPISAALRSGGEDGGARTARAQNLLSQRSKRDESLCPKFGAEVAQKYPKAKELDQNLDQKLLDPFAN